MKDTLLRKLPFACVTTAVFIGLYLSSLYNYLLFHSFAEIFSAVVGAAVFLLVWNSKKYIENQGLVFIGVAYLFVAFLDLMHTLAFKGMNVFKDYDYYANQLWVVARYMESITLLLAFSIYRFLNRVKPMWVFTVYLLCTALLIASILAWRVFPVCFIEGKGQTDFKIISEYVICFILILSAFFLIKNRKKYDPKVYKILLWSIAFTVLSELAFTLYISNYDILNLIGHYLKVISFYLIYKAIIKTGIEDPYEVIFRELLIKEKKLEEAKELAEVASRLKSSFLANMSHEIRTPLNSVLGFTDLLLEEEKDKEKAEKLTIVSQSGKHLLNLVNDILDFSKIEAGKLSIEKRSFSIHSVLNEVKNVFLLKSIEKDIYLNYSVQDTVPKFLLGDEYRIRQILINLVGNAVKFTEQGGIEIQCGYENKVLNIMVKDTGIGIAEDNKQTIFSAFEQVDSSATRKYGGTGLGLSITKNLVEIMGGKIGLESEVGKGTQFHVQIPLESVEVPMQVLEETFDTPGDKKGHSQMHKIALIMDLDLENAYEIVENIRRIIHSENRQILLFTHGSQTLEKVNQSHIDLILVDQRIEQRMDWSWTKELGEDFRTSYIPIVKFIVGEIGGIQYIVDPRTCIYVRNDIPYSLGEWLDMFFAGREKAGEKMVETWVEKFGDELELRELVFECIGDIAIRMETLERAIADCNVEGIRYLSHSLKGSTGNFRMMEFYELSSKIETEIKKRDCRMDMVKSHYSRMKEVLSLIPKKYLLYNEIANENNEDLSKKLNILVVEDNEMNQKLVGQLLKRMNFKYRIANNGKEALEGLEKEKFDLVLLDAQMPVMDGADTLARIREDERLGNIPVIIVTANVILEDIERFFKLGCDDYISKPIDKNILQSKIMYFTKQSLNVCQK
ncbi:MAG: response regulator [Clostridia bacterium]|nr:response regulator [Clostridia bacterium]